MAQAQRDVRAYRRPVVQTGPPVDLLRLHAAFPDRYPVLLESAAGAAALARYDILFGFPEEVLEVAWDRRLSGPYALAGRRFLQALDHWWAAEQGATATTLPFAGGWFLFLAYELAQEVEPSLQLLGEPSLPLARAWRVPVAVVRDRHVGRTWMIAEPGRAARLRDIETDACRLIAWDSRRRAASANELIVPGSIVADPPEAYLSAVKRVQRHIAAGDVYQVNLARQWRAQLTPDITPWMVYQRLRQTNPAPFAGIAVLDGGAIISSSPERLIAQRDGIVNTRPIAGTRPRHAGAPDDAERRAELLASAKERAEHVMLIDLERNDLGRVCRAGSVRVSEFMGLESYAHVHHIVSNITGELRPGTTPGQLIRAVFPGGTITGCPKLRCMELIRTIEARPRGAFTGAMGYLGLDGSLDLNILIRTITMRDREILLHAGSGIVADSAPAQELEETCAKARGMLLALETPWTPSW